MQPTKGHQNSQSVKNMQNNTQFMNDSYGKLKKYVQEKIAKKSNNQTKANNQVKGQISLLRYFEPKINQNNQKKEELIYFQEKDHNSSSMGKHLNNFVDKYSGYFNYNAEGNSIHNSQSIHSDFFQQKSITQINQSHNFSRNSIKTDEAKEQELGKQVNQSKQIKQISNKIKSKQIKKQKKEGSKQFQTKLQNYFGKVPKSKDFELNSVSQQEQKYDWKAFENREQNSKNIMNVNWNQINHEIQQYASDHSEYQEQYRQPTIQRRNTVFPLDNGQNVNIIVTQSPKNQLIIDGIQFKLSKLNSYLTVSYRDVEEHWGCILKAVYQSYM